MKPLPCPFCGKEPTIRERVTHAVVACVDGNCAAGPGAAGRLLSDAIAAWNTRADPVRRLARNQPCGCVVCVCKSETHCSGCGAKACGTHPIPEIPNPVYEPPDPVRAALATPGLGDALRRAWLSDDVDGDVRRAINAIADAADAAKEASRG